MRMPKGVSAASGRPAAGLSCSQHKMKLLSAGVKTEFFSAGLSSPLMNAVPAGYFTQICNTTAAEQRANSLYSTPHGPEAKPIRASSGRLPVKIQTHTLGDGDTLWSIWGGGGHLIACKVCMDWEVVIFGSPLFVKRGATSGPHSGGQLVWLLGMSKQLGTLIHSKQWPVSPLYCRLCRHRKHTGM